MIEKTGFLRQVNGRSSMWELTSLKLRVGDSDKENSEPCCRWVQDLGRAAVVMGVDGMCFKV
jgi:hypothetical protein